MLRASVTEALKRALFLHNQNQRCNYFPTHMADPCYSWRRKLRFNQCNSSIPVNWILVFQNNKGFWHLPFSLPCLPKSWGSGGDEISCLLSKTVQHRDCSSPHIPYVYHKYLSFRGSFVILTLIKNRNTKPSKLGSSSVSLHSPIPSVLFLLYHWARGINILYAVECYKRAHIPLLLTALITASPYVFSPHQKSPQISRTSQKPPTFLSQSKVSHFSPRKTGTKSYCYCLKITQGSPRYFCLRIQSPHGVILMEWQFFSCCPVQRQSCCATYSFRDVAQIADNVQQRWWLTLVLPNPVMPKQSDPTERQLLGRASGQPIVQRTF